MITVYQSSVELGDPHICSDSTNRLSLIFSVYEALVKPDATGAYQPSLAESWSVGEEALDWTFRLRKNVTFHNGEILCADDVVATLGRVLDPTIGGAFGTQGVYLSYLGDAEITKLDEIRDNGTVTGPEALLTVRLREHALRLFRAFFGDLLLGSGFFNCCHKN